ncbi:hypothetical protein [Streptomyces sp. NBC_01465]|uniref:hypothetical protein n=1 Tax=Streptomyces sp. NBC_01465 TaxID=2903878 RepID=UPI002E3554A7|nr:hypothetical protein [Streptomyces sp. NBC_01465]
MATLRAPVPLGYGNSATEVQSIAAPLLAAAALSLAGVVAAASGPFFRWPGATLLLLVGTALLLVASIQLRAYARQYLYSRQDIHDWYPETVGPQTEDYFSKLYEFQGEDYNTWVRFTDRAVRCFNAGTILLGCGVAAVLVPPPGSSDDWWRWSAMGLVLACTLVDVFWTLSIQPENGRLRIDRKKELNEILSKPRGIS